MKIIRPGVFLALIALLVLTGSARSQPATIAWPEAVAQLAGERAKAETCVALIKKYGDDGQIARGPAHLHRCEGRFWTRSLPD